MVDDVQCIQNPYHKANKKKYQTFSPPSSAQSPSPTKLGMVIEVDHNIFTPLKIFTPDVCREKALKIWGNCTPSYNPINSVVMFDI